MSWFVQKLNIFVAASAIALAAAVASQGQAFAVQYLQRAGSHLEEARAHLEDVQSGLRYRVMGETVRAELEADARTRVTALDRAYTKVKKASPLLRPFAILQYGDHEIVTDTRHDFIPALPTTAGSITFTVLGMVLGFVVFEVVKLPLAVFARDPRRRRFRKRG
jgi:hypothetical protein